MGSSWGCEFSFSNQRRDRHSPSRGLGTIGHDVQCFQASVEGVGEEHPTLALDHHIFHLNFCFKDHDHRLSSASVADEYKFGSGRLFVLDFVASASVADEYKLSTG